MIGTHTKPTIKKTKNKADSENINPPGINRKLTTIDDELEQ